MVRAFWCMSKFAGRPVRTWALTLLLAPQLFAEGPTIRIPRIEVAPTLSDFSDMEPNARATIYVVETPPVDDTKTIWLEPKTASN